MFFVFFMNFQNVFRYLVCLFQLNVKYIITMGFIQYYVGHLIT